MSARVERPSWKGQPAQRAECAEDNVGAKGKQGDNVGRREGTACNPFQPNQDDALQTTVSK